jgi:hypothetical protein
VVLELGISQIEVVKVTAPLKDKTPEEFLQDEKMRDAAFRSFMGRMVEGISNENRKIGGDGNVTGIVVS